MPAEPQPRAPAYSARYEMLDIWRGLAATGVVVAHVLDIALFGPALLGRASVLCFFVISGYCITAAAQSALRQTLSFKSFMMRRFRRIYPPYLLSVAYYVATRLLKWRSGIGNDLSSDPVQWLQNLTLTQWVTGLRHPQPFPTVGPLFNLSWWSLCFEEQFYLVMAGLIAIAVRWGVRLRTCVACVTAVAIVWNAFNQTLVHGIFLDYWLQFAIGSLVYYVLTEGWTISIQRWVCAGLAVAAIVTGVYGWRLGFNPLNYNDRSLFLEVSEVCAFALMLILLRSYSEAWRVTLMGRWLAALGLISYSLYLNQSMNFRATNAVATKLLPAAVPRFLYAVVVIALQILLAIPFWFFCERPFVPKKREEKAALREPAAAV